jgi:hypothetical protein
VLELLGTVGCHLCDDAEQVLKQLSLVRPISWRYTDIALDDALCQQYGERIPVLRRGEEAALYWPFSVLDVERFLTLGIT